MQPDPAAFLKNGFRRPTCRGDAATARVHRNTAPNRHDRAPGHRHRVHVTRDFRKALSAAIVALASGLVAGGMAAAQQNDGAAESTSGRQELQIRWQYFAPIEGDRDSENKLADVVLGPSVFTHSRLDLGDLRLYGDTDKPLSYALRIRRPEYRSVPFEAAEYNRGDGPDGSRELALDLRQDDIEHNEVEIETNGSSFRRKVEVAGSDDGTAWSTIATSNLLKFRRGTDAINVDTVSYPPSRYRYLRIRVFPDPVVDQGRFEIGTVKAMRKIEVPGEMLTLDGQLGPWLPTRAQGQTASAWVIELGGDKVPCEKIEIDVDDAEFARNYYIEAAGPVESQERFYRVGLTSDGFWQRRAGETRKPMVATFNEVQASRLRLVVIDYQNPHLNIRSVKFSAPARQVVFQRPAADAKRRLFFGNPEAEPPNYDFARNLPARLEPTPARATLGDLQDNPAFVPPPQPLTERWPWLIYVVLGAVSVVLAAIIASLARTAVAIHDQSGGDAAELAESELSGEAS